MNDWWVGGWVVYLRITSFCSSTIPAFTFLMRAVVLFRSDLSCLRLALWVAREACTFSGLLSSRRAARVYWGGRWVGGWVGG